MKPDSEAGREIAEATKALGANPNDVAALQKRARAYTKEHQHEQALADYAKAVELKPDDASLHYGRGTALQNLRRYEEALRAYDEALRLAPGHANARNSHGHANRALKRYDAALQDFDELIRDQPEFIHAYYNRGLVYRDMSRNEDAGARLRRHAGAGQGLHRRLHQPRPGLREDGLARQGHRGLPHRAGDAAEIQQRRLGARPRANGSRRSAPPRRSRDHPIQRTAAMRLAERDQNSE